MDNQLLWHNFYQEINQPDEHIDLAKAALYYAQAEYPELNVSKQLSVLDAIASQIRPQLPDEMYPLKVIKTINYHLFDCLRFRGNQKDYYNAQVEYLEESVNLC